MSAAARSTLVFSQPPRSIHLVGQAPVITYTSEEFDKAVKEAYEKGAEETRKSLETESEKSRDGVKFAAEGALSKLADRHSEALSMMRSLVPNLVTEATARVVAGLPVDAEFVRRVVDDLLNDVAPGAENVEVQLCAEDVAKVAGFDQELRHKFPTLRVVENRDIKPGDCLVKTRFGVLDGRISSKMKAVESLLT
jgi:flagellar assembly protein FliH